MSSYTIPNVIERTPTGGERVADVFSRLVSDRIVVIGTPIDEGVATSVIAQLLHLENESPQTPVDLVLNSSGADEFSALAIHDTMSFIRCPVTATVVGQAVGASALLLAGAEPGHRMVLPHARVVLQQVAAESGRRAIPDLIPEAEEVLRVRGVVEELLAAASGHTPQQIRTATDRTLVLPGQAAVDFGVADLVIASREPDTGAMTTGTAAVPA
ncbi:ATP-dependent Clp protease proteolytic subunit [Galactobacter sp.]|uniref:ClpP family protease n=1 Tax=Galactobacter sp. TaxID=2676125 RepID=UPI0025C207B2|nr:ATP-dependent Clp protease proteolytic subunit [Galactobacter sp.]